MTNKFTYLLLVVLLITFASEVKGQSIPATLIIDPSSQITDGQNYNFVARDKVLLKPGVKYKPNSAGISFHAKIDENIILPTSYRGSSTSTTRNTLSTTLNVGTTAGIAGVNEMGQSEYNIPIHVPPGISGMIPGLSIKYTLNNRLGRLGIGWDIAGLSTIKRQGNNLYFDNKTNDPEFDEHDNYSLDGQRLLKITNLTSNNTYACENENHLRVTAIGGTVASPNYFEAKTIDGVTYEYGRNNANCKSTNNQKVVEWYINKIIDEHDNYIEFVYNEHNGQVYLEKILYTGNTNAGILPFNEIQFFYDEKQDANSYYINGERFENNLILRKIKTKAEGETVKLYEFVYAYNQGTKLVEIIENNSENKPYNSTLINWGNEILSLEQKNENNKVISSKVTPTYLTSWGDIDNDGKNDMLLFDASGTNVNTPYVAHISSRNSTLSLSGIRLPQTTGLVVESSATLFDFNGDGKSEIYLFTVSNNVYGIVGYQYENGAFVPVNNSLTQYTFTANPIKPGAKETFQLAPINFSGQVDNFDVAIVNTSVLENNNQISFFYQRVLGVVDNSGQTNNHLNDFIADQNALIVNFYDVRKLYFTDLNSDGKTDILEVYSLVDAFTNGKNFTLLQRSYKESESKYEVTYLTNDMQADFLHDFHLGDYNGDGNFDILTLVDGKWSIYTGKGNSFETTPFEVPQLNLPSGVDKQDISFIDMNSDGYYDITYMTYIQISQNKYGEYLNVLYSDGNNFLLNTIGSFERIKRYRCTQQNEQYIELLPMLRHQVLFDQNNDGNLDLFYLSDIDRSGTFWDCDETIFTYNLLKINNGLHNNKVVEIVNGMNESAKFTYQNNGALASNNSYKRTRNFNGNFGVLYKTKHLTTSLTKAIHNSNEVLQTTVFTYENGVYNTLGKGFLGYLNMTTTTEWPQQAANKKIVTKQLNANHAFLYTSQVINQTHNGTNFVNISTIDNVFSMATGLVSSKQYRQHLTSKIFYNNTNGISNVTNYSDFNTLGYPGKIEEYTGNGAKLKTTTLTYTQVNTNLGDNKVSKIITEITAMPNSGNTTPYSGPTYYNTTEYTYYSNGNINTKVDYSD